MLLAALEAVCDSVEDDLAAGACVRGAVGEDLGWPDSG